MSKVDLAEMDKIGQLFDRQKGYLTTGQSFISTNARPAGFTGVLSFLEPHYQRCFEAGTKGMANGVSIADKSSRTIKANYAQYVSDDKAAYDRLHKYDKNAKPYEAPKGQLGPGGTPKAPAGPNAATRVWDGTKWVTKMAKTGAGHVGTVNDVHNRGANNSAKRKDIERLGDKAKDATKLGGKDTKWAEDPWGNIKKKASEAAANAHAKAQGYKGDEDRTAKLTDKYRESYREKRAEVRAEQRANGETPDKTRPFLTPSAEKQHALNGAIDAVQKPGELVNEAQGVYDSGKRFIEEIQRAAAIHRVSNSNTRATTTWADDQGGTW